MYVLLGTRRTWSECVLKKILIVVLVLVACVIVLSNENNKKQDEWKTFDGEDIVCRFVGCGNRPLYSNWEDRYCSDHIDRSKNASNIGVKTKGTRRTNTTPALTKEQADALVGTGYHGTKPNSSAESSEIKAAMVKCKKCGMHSTNGANSKCNECLYNESMGFD